MAIAGTLANKQDAACIILEKIQDFRNSDYDKPVSTTDRRERYDSRDRNRDSRDKSEYKRRSVRKERDSSYDRDRRRGKFLMENLGFFLEIKVGKVLTFDR